MLVSFVQTNIATFLTKGPKMLRTERKHVIKEVVLPYVGDVVQSTIVTQEHFATILGIGKSKPVWVGGGANHWANKENLRRERLADTESGNQRFYWTFGILKARRIWPWFYPLWWKHGLRCDVKTLYGVWGPFGPSVPEASEVQPASRGRGYSFPAEVQPETADGEPREPGVPSGLERRTQANSRWGAGSLILRKFYTSDTGLA